jgi:hypothetical protein
MSWREFQLRAYGYERSQTRELQKTRLVAYSAKFPAFGASKIPSIERFMPIDGEKINKSVSDSQKQAFLKAFEKYQKQKKSE